MGKVARSALWLLAEFADSPARAQAALTALQAVIPDLSGNSDEDKVRLQLENESLQFTTCTKGLIEKTLQKIYGDTNVTCISITERYIIFNLLEKRGGTQFNCILVCICYVITPTFKDQRRFR